MQPTITSDFPGSLIMPVPTVHIPMPKGVAVPAKLATPQAPAQAHSASK